MQANAFGLEVRIPGRHTGGVRDPVRQLDSSDLSGLEGGWITGPTKYSSHHALAGLPTQCPPSSQIR